MGSKNDHFDPGPIKLLLCFCTNFILLIPTFLFSPPQSSGAQLEQPNASAEHRHRIRPDPTAETTRCKRNHIRPYGCNWWSYGCLYGVPEPDSRHHAHRIPGHIRMTFSTFSSFFFFLFSVGDLVRCLFFAILFLFFVFLKRRLMNDHNVWGIPRIESKQTTHPPINQQPIMCDDYRTNPTTRQNGLQTKMASASAAEDDENLPLRDQTWGEFCVFRSSRDFAGWEFFMTS